MADDIYGILADIRKSQHQTELLLESIKGEGKLQSQALAYHIDNLKEYKQVNDAKTDDIDARVKKIEVWQVRIAALMALVTAVFAVMFDDLKAWIFGK